jgi:hypothetical protein
VDTFDPKPELTRLHGEKLPASFGPVKTRRGVDKNKLLASKRTFTKHGQSGIEVSDWFPHLAECVDDLCILRGCRGDSVTHPESVYQMNTGSILMGRPSLGAWATYGLGTENRNMPAFVVLPDPAGWPKGGAPAWGNGFLPAAYQGTLVRGGATPVSHLATPPGVSADQQQRTLDFIGQSNRDHLVGRAGDSELAARIAAYELAFRMQAHAPTSHRNRTTRSGSTVWTGRRPPSSACGVCSPGGWSSAASGLCNCTAATPTAGTPIRTSKATTASSACRATSRSPACCRISSGAVSSIPHS